MSSSANRSCPICKAMDFRTLLTAADPDEPSAKYDIAECLSCRCICTLGITPDYAPQYFSIDWFKKLLPGMGSSRMRAADFAGWNRSDSGRLLDFGSGEGGFVALARAHGWDARGLDPFAPRADFRSIEELESSNFTPDLITLWHSLEHLDDPIPAVRRLSARLAPNGALFVAVPNFDSAQAQWGGPVWFHLDAPRHRVHYTRESLALLAARADLSLEDFSGPRSEYDPAGWIQTIANRIFRRPNAFYRLLKGDRTAVRTGIVSAMLLPVLLPIACFLSLYYRVRPATCEMILRPRMDPR